MSNRPRVSVLVPLFNKELEVARAINSVLAQSETEFELIVIDDGSTDSGPAIVHGYSDPRIRMVSQTNAGVSAARNRGIELARADLVAFLDADDEWRPVFLTTILRLKDKFPECAVYATSYEICRGNGLCRPAAIRGLPNEFKDGVLEDYFKVAACSAPPLWTSAVAVNKGAIQDVGGFPIGIGSGEDLLTWAKLALKHKIAYSAESLAIFWEPEDVDSRPGRIPTTPDLVGEELRRIAMETQPNGLPGIVDYLALWHRMRGVIFLQLANSQEARGELKKAMQFAGPSVELLALLLVSMLPGRSARFIYHAIKNFSIRWATSV